MAALALVHKVLLDCPFGLFLVLHIKQPSSLDSPDNTGQDVEEGHSSKISLSHCRSLIELSNILAICTIVGNAIGFDL